MTWLISSVPRLPGSSFPSLRHLSLFEVSDHAGKDELLKFLLASDVLHRLFFIPWFPRSFRRLPSLYRPMLPFSEAHASLCRINKFMVFFFANSFSVFLSDGLCRSRFFHSVLLLYPPNILMITPKETLLLSPPLQYPMGNNFELRKYMELPSSQFLCACTSLRF